VGHVVSRLAMKKVGTDPGDTGDNWYVRIWGDLWELAL
jgi:hypothetical protein